MLSDSILHAEDHHDAAEEALTRVAGDDVAVCLARDGGAGLAVDDGELAEAADRKDVVRSGLVLAVAAPKIYFLRLSYRFHGHGWCNYAEWQRGCSRSH